ncbi:DUF4406 domain-containing protein [Uniformispora flossi]|uniref:DUF4406 domain-containing protein n=1 Tax=Uniformispora flossi TaxID=3390723 RepID=UPI003C2E4DD3
MTGIPEHNYPAFHRAEERLKERGWDVTNPARHFDGDTDRDYDEYIRADLTELVDPHVIAIFMLEGWQNSNGARLEHAIARNLGLQVLSAAADAAAQPIELEAQQLVRNGARQQVYGHPRSDFQRTAGIWSGYLSAKLREPIAPEDVALMMAGLKMSRLAATPGHRGLHRGPGRLRHLLRPAQRTRGAATRLNGGRWSCIRQESRGELIAYEKPR